MYKSLLVRVEPGFPNDQTPLTAPLRLPKVASGDFHVPKGIEPVRDHGILRGLCGHEPPPSNRFLLHSMEGGFTRTIGLKHAHSYGDTP